MAEADDQTTNSNQDEEVVDQQTQAAADDSTADDQTAADAVDEDEADTDTDTADTADDEDVPPKPSRREQLRINQLLAKYGDPDEDDRPTKPAKQSRRQDDDLDLPELDGLLNYEDELDADPETVKRLTEDRADALRQVYAQGRREAQADRQADRFRTLLEIDAPQVEGKYSFLDKNSDDFDPQYATAMNRKYLAMVGYNTKTGHVQRSDIRYRDFVEAEIEFANRMAERRTEATRQTIAKQSAATGLRPDGGGAKKLDLTKAPQDMTDEELKAYIGQALPK